MKTLRFGIEIETIGQTRAVLAKALQTVVGGTVHDVGGFYETFEVLDTTGRTWKLMTDASLQAPRSLQAEIVSPILTWNDLETLQEVVRAVREAGAKVDASCGIHVHVDAQAFDAAKLCTLAKLVHQQEDLLVAALGVRAQRLERYTRKVDADFIQTIEAKRPRTLDALNAAWYGFHNARPEHYDSTRYHGLNLHSVWFRGTIEFRYFESVLHAGKVKAYVQLCLALAHKALSARSAMARKRTLNAATARYDVRVFLLRLGMIGDDFKTARLHLLANLGGSAAWKNTRPALRVANDNGARAATEASAA